MRISIILLLSLLGVACARRPAPPGEGAVGAAGGARDVVTSSVSDSESLPNGANWGGYDSYGPGDHQRVDTPEPLRMVTPAPAIASEALLPSGVTPIAIAASNTRPEAALLAKNPDGSAAVLRWEAGGGGPSTLVTLPVGFEPKSIAYHPQRAKIFVAGRLGARSQILALTQLGSSWSSAVIFESPAEINRLVVGPRPFSGADGERFRLFFAAKTGNGSTSLRTITEEGRIEYQVAGPKETVVTIPDEEFQPGTFPAPYAVPSAMHPEGETLVWQDQQGCAHLVRYDFQEMWHDDRILRGIPCGSVVRVPPNGRGYIAWTGGKPGVAVLDDSITTSSPQAAADTFLTTPALTPDGRGLLGVVDRGAGRVAVVYAPVAIPLADVANAWTYSFDRCDLALLQQNGGFFRESGGTYGPPQIYELYDAMNYGSGAESPKLVTTDLLWETFAAAYNGAFILQERRRALPVFHALVRAADSVLSRSAPTSMWGKAFAALAAADRGETSGEAGQILNGAEPARSTVIDSTFDFSELKPRGHYTSSPAMEKYFREVHYLTSLSAIRGRDAAPLSALPPAVQRLATAWIEGYRTFIAPSRAPVLWDGSSARTMAPYAKHPWDHAAVFPLSWGIDNEVLESTVYHDTWPAEEQIEGPGGRRLHPSGVDVAEMFGSALGRTLLRNDLAAYPRLGPVLNGIAARRPTSRGTASLYQRWLDALAVEWADSTSFPGAPAGSSLWSAKRLQTGLASWATLREATILVTERPSAAEAGEGGFEEVVPEIPRGYVEPAPKTFEAIAGLYDALAASLSIDGDSALQTGAVGRLEQSAAEAREFAQMARKELRGEPLTDAEYSAIRVVGGTVEHEFLLYKALADKDLAIGIPEPMGKIADVAGDTRLGILEVAVGDPLHWHQIVPYFGRREIALGSVYSYYEFTSHELYDNARWRRELAQHPHPEWIRPLIAPAPDACRAPVSR